MSFSQMTAFSLKYRKILWVRLMNASLVNEFISCFTLHNLVPLPKHSCPILLGKEENCYRIGSLLLRVLEVVISASQFCLRCTMFKVKHGWDPYTLYTRKCFFIATWKICWFQSFILCFNILPDKSRIPNRSSKDSGRN